MHRCVRLLDGQFCTIIQAMSKPQTVDLSAALQQAIAGHRAGQLAVAEKAYRIVIHTQPDHAEANHNLGVLLIQSGRIEEGLAHLRCALASNHHEALHYLSYARGLLAAGSPAQAEAILEQGRRQGLTDVRFETLRLQIQTSSTGHCATPEDLHAAAIQHHRAGRLDEAVKLYRQAIEKGPANRQAYQGLAGALFDLGDYDTATQTLREALTLSPDNAALLDDLGSALLAKGRIEEAIQAYENALAVEPDFADAHYHLGSVLSENDRVADGFAHYMRRAALVYGQGLAPPTDKPDPPHKVKHDQEQRDYLAGGKASADAPSVPDMFQLADGSRIDGPAVNPANVTNQLIEDWRQSRPQMVVIDNFLMVPALEKLRAYCAGSTVWRKIYSAGYLGAAPEDGFACPLLAQIVEEIQSTFRPILKGEQFRYLGAFKYDSELSTGTNTHADNSALNVNFYIAPDEANLDPQHGGMEIWDVGVPDIEAQRKYSSDEAAIRDFLKRSGAKSTIIPHRSNRAIIFKSAMIHKTDTFQFKSDYLSRRINISLLFGQLG